MLALVVAVLLFLLTVLLFALLALVAFLLFALAILLAAPLLLTLFVVLVVVLVHGSSPSPTVRLSRTCLIKASRGTWFPRLRQSEGGERQDAELPR